VVRRRRFSQFLPMIAVGILMALSPSNASAVTVSVEGGSACPALTVSAGGCVFHLKGEIELLAHPFAVETELSDCNLELGGRVDSTGNAKIDSVVYTDHSGVNDCLRSNCNTPWPASFSGSGVNFTLTTTFCFKPDSGSPNQTCQMGLPIVEFSGHSYVSSFHLRALASGNITNCELEGQFSFEGADIEFS
jgi:hypothetical protein